MAKRTSKVVHINEKTTKKAAAKKKVPASNGAVSASHNEDAVRSGFHDFRRKWLTIQNRVKAADKELREMVADAKSAGYQKQEFVIADMLSSGAKKEAKVVAAVETRLRVAKWMGHAMGNQLDLFAQPDRTPSVDVAADAGKQAAMENERASPPYAPETEQYRAWMDGYHEEQARQVRVGIRPVHGENDPARPLA